VAPVKPLESAVRFGRAGDLVDCARAADRQSEGVVGAGVIELIAPVPALNWTAVALSVPGANAAAPAAPPMLSVPTESTMAGDGDDAPTETAPPFEIVNVPAPSRPIARPALLVQLDPAPSIVAVPVELDCSRHSPRHC